jgi:hypothetical protein
MSFARKQDVQDLRQDLESVKLALATLQRSFNITKTEMTAAKLVTRVAALEGKTVAAPKAKKGKKKK